MRYELPEPHEHPPIIMRGHDLPRTQVGEGGVIGRYRLQLGAKKDKEETVIGWTLVLVGRRDIKNSKVREQRLWGAHQGTNASRTEDFNLI